MNDGRPVTPWVYVHGAARGERKARLKTIPHYLGDCGTPGVGLIMESGHLRLQVSHAARMLQAYHRGHGPAQRTTVAHAALLQAPVPSAWHFHFIYHQLILQHTKMKKMIKMTQYILFTKMTGRKSKLQSIFFFTFTAMF